MSEYNTKMIPTVHLNGTGLETLQRGWTATADALDEAIAKANAIEFNSRDYYPAGPEAFERARDEMVEHLLALKRFANDAHEVVEALNEVRRSREERLKQ